MRPEMASDLVERVMPSLVGTSHVPGSGGWDAARAAWQLRVDQRPALVVEAEHPGDVVDAVRGARSAGLRVAIQNTGHGASALGDLRDVVLVRTRGLQQLHVDRETRLLHVGAGVLWADAVRAAATHGLAALAGSAGDVGVIGYTLGGGLSWFGRRYGFAANDVVAFEAVTADGALVRVDRTRHPDLFWAMRGGGGSFAAVVAAKLALRPIPELGAGLLAWPQERAAEVARHYIEWTRHVSEETASCFRLMNVPDSPDAPGLVRGRSLVLVEVVHQGSDIDDIVAPLRALAPELDTVAAATPEGILGLHMDPPAPVPVVGDGLVLGNVDERAVDVLLRSVGPGTASPLLSLEVRHLGGALGRPDASGGCLSHVEGDFVLFAVGVAPDDATAAILRQRIRSLQEALSPWRAAHDLLNYREVRRDPAQFFPPPTLRRLREVRERYDVDRLFVANHPIP